MSMDIKWFKAINILVVGSGCRIETLVPARIPYGMLQYLQLCGAHSINKQRRTLPADSN